MSEQQDELFELDDDLGALLEKVADLPEQSFNNWPKLLQDLYAVLNACLKRNGMSFDEASKLTRQLVTAQAHYYGGRHWYLPKNLSLDKALRDCEIWQRFNGQNHRQLAKEYKLTDQAIYNIIKTQRQIELSRRQGGLF